MQVGWRKISACEVSDEATEPDPGIVAAAAERVRAWSTTADADRPWLVYAGLRRPHLPCNAPAAHFARYPVAGVKLATPAERAWVVGGLDWDNSGELRNGYADFGQWSDGQSPPEPYTDWMPADRARALRRAYFAAISFVDEMVGRLLAQVQASRPEAVVVFTSDHGFQLGEHQQWTKHSLLEAALRIPFVIAAPALAHRAGAVVREPAEALLGLLPTLLELSGVGIPSGLVLQGHSLAPLLLRGALPLDRPCPVRASSVLTLTLTLTRTPTPTPTPTRCAPLRCAASLCLPGSPAATSCGTPPIPLTTDPFERLPKHAGPYPPYSPLDIPRPRRARFSTGCSRRACHSHILIPSLAPS